MKGRLEQATLSPVGFALRAQQSLARDALAGLEGETGEVPRVGDQHFADEVRVTGQVEVDRAEAVVGEVAVGTGDLPQEFRWVAPEREKQGSGNAVPGSRWLCWGDSPVGDGNHCVIPAERRNLQ